MAERQITQAPDLLFDSDKQQGWRALILRRISLVAVLIGLTAESGSLYLYYSIPANQNPQMMFFVITGGLFCIASVFSWLYARKGKDQYALAWFVVVFWAGPPMLGSFGIQGLGRLFNYPIMIISFLAIALLSSQETASRRNYQLIAAYIIASVINLLLYEHKVPSPELYRFMQIMVPLTTIAVIIVMVSQFFRLFINEKILLAFMLLVGVFYQMALSFAGTYAQADYRLQSWLTILDIVLGVIAFAILYIANLISTPVKELIETALNVYKGNLSIQHKVKSIDEFGLLGTTFNKMIASVRENQEHLEHMVVSRTRDLNVASQVSREIIRELNLDQLLPKLVEKTREAFSLYYVSLFLFNLQTQELSLEAGSGEPGEHMKSQAKAFHLSAQPSLVAKAAREQKAEIVNDTSKSGSYFFNPILPNTKAEAAIPMTVGNELVGVLDLQSDIPNRFAESDIQIFSTLAEQIAIAIRNAQLYRNQEKVAEELKRTDLMKSQFLASMSHELRTPMNAIINLVEMVASEMIGSISEEQKTFLNQSLQSSRHLLHLINDVLDISKIQSGQLTLYLENDVNIYEEINTVVTIISPLISDPVKFTQHIDTNIPLIEADRRRVRQILLNLLSNAAKFTEQGTISLILKNQSTQLLFTVADSGPGIPITAQAIIFEPFIQTEDGRKRVEGTGLGLPISKKLIEAHGGRLWVDSQPGEGATFHFTLPILHNSLETHYDLKNETNSFL